MTSNNLDFVARCMIGHNTKDIKSLISEVENIQNDIGGVKIVQITKEDYDALTDKPTNVIYLVSDGNKITLYIGGTEVNEIEGIKVNNTTINPDSNKVVNITVPTTAADVSALPDTTKYAAALSLTINSSTYVMTGQLKDQNGDNLGTAQTIDLPLESVVVGGSYNSQTKKVVLTLQNGNTVEFSVADLVSGLQTELSMSNKLNPAFIEYDSTHRAVSDTEKSMWNSKQNALSSTQLDAVNSGIDSTKVAQIETNKNNILTVQNNMKLCYASLTSNLINAPDKTMTATGFVFQEIATKLLANTEYIFYFTINSKAPMNLVGYTKGQSGRTIDIGILTTKQQIGVNAIKFTPSAQVDTISLYINYQTEDVTYSGMIITPTITAINVIS